jgi:lipoyl(octanoyl) transferase
MTPIVRSYPITDYALIWQAMRQFTDVRTSDTPDEIWLLEHFPVYTQGQSGKPEHVLAPGDIPIVQTDRGGQVTYHGPQQLIAYVLLDLHRRSLTIRNLVTLLEQSVIHVLADYGIKANSRCDAPGVYVEGAKICSLGLRVRRGRCYHGLALNVGVDLKPFSGINPCGYRDLSVTRMVDLVSQVNFETVKEALHAHLLEALP